MEKRRILISKKQILFLSLIFFISVFLIPQQLLAITNGQIGIRPAYPDPGVPTSKGRFDYSLAPGESKEDAVEIINTTDQEITIKVYPVDATTTPDGIFALGMEEVVQDVGAWIKLSKDEVTLAPASSEIVSFTFTVPAGSEPGDHMGGIVIQEKEPPQGEGSITIITRVGVRIYERVPGDIIRDLEITGFNWEFSAETPEELKQVNLGKLQSFLGFRRKVNFTVGIHNKGTVREEVKANTTVMNMLGKEVANFDTENGMIFPQNDIVAHVEWIKAGSWPLFGRYKATVSVSYDKEIAPITATLAFWAVPYSLFVLIGILIALGILLYLNRLLIKELAKREMEVYLIRPGDSLAVIAEHFGVNWKKLARINNIKQPYHLKPDSYLFIPQGSILKLFFRQLARKKSRLWMLIVAVLIVVVALGGLVYHLTNKEEKTAEPTVPEKNETINFKPSLSETRDNTRKADLKNIQSALQIFHSRYNRYPLAPELIKTNQVGSILAQELAANGYLAELPKDPQDPTYYYGYKSDGQTYELTSILENSSDPEAVQIHDYSIYRLTSTE